jgi:Na+/H+ antiporter NhaC
VSTWIGVELGYLTEYYDSASGQSALYVFVASIPYRFYPLLMLAFVLLTILMSREFGPMQRARPLAHDEEPDAHEDASPGWLEAGLPLGAVLGVVFVSIFVEASEARARASLDWGAAIAEVDSLRALFLGAFVGVALAVAFRVRRARTPRIAILELATGARTMVAPCLILLGAWALGGSLRVLGAGDVLALWVTEASAAQWVPALVFATAAVASFVTGTSWGTMAILFPIAIPLVQGLPSVSEQQQLATVGAVLAGAVFGDHCSPISDTTIMSAAAAGCDPMAHVVTQLPYALLVGGASLGATLWVGYAETPPLAVLGGGLLVVALLLRLLGRPTGSPSSG